MPPDDLPLLGTVRRLLTVVDHELDRRLAAHVATHHTRRVAAPAPRPPAAGWPFAGVKIPAADVRRMAELMDRGLSLPAAADELGWPIVAAEREVAKLRRIHGELVARLGGTA